MTNYATNQDQPTPPGEKWAHTGNDAPYSGTDRLLAAASRRHEDAAAVDEMRRDGCTAVRYLLPPAGAHGHLRGEVRLFRFVLPFHRDRRRIAAVLAGTAEYAIPEGAVWQLFDGQTWVPLLPSSPFTAEEVRARLEELHTRHQQTTRQGDGMRNAVLNDGRYATGAIIRGRGSLTITARPVDELTIRGWCRCPRRKTPDVHFERWNCSFGFNGSGFIHGSRTCGGLLNVA